MTPATTDRQDSLPYVLIAWALMLFTAVFAVVMLVNALIDGAQFAIAFAIGLIGVAVLGIAYAVTLTRSYLRHR